MKGIFTTPCNHFFIFSPPIVALKNQEIEELTKICDELIAKIGKTD